MERASSEDMMRAIVALKIIGGQLALDGDMPTKTPCRDCKHCRSNDFTHRVLCAKPCAMTGSPHGIKKGWFMYPLNFDPVWRTRECDNYEPVAGASAVSGAVSQAEQ